MTEHDVLQEAKDRHEFEKREALGTVDGEDVHIVTALNKHGNPYVCASYGGDWEFDTFDGRNFDEFAHATSHMHRFERASEAEEHFEELVEKYELNEGSPRELMEVTQ